MNKKYFPDVFKDFMDWILHVLLQCRRGENKDFFPGDWLKYNSIRMFFKSNLRNSCGKIYPDGNY